MKTFFHFIIFVLFLNFSLYAKDSPREIITVKNEKTLFAIFNLLAKATPNIDISKISGGETTYFITGDNRRLSGYRLKANSPPKGYLLLLQGNAFPADQLIQYFEPIRNLGIDIYAFDYRGYLKSEGKRRVYAMKKDYEEIVASLNKKYQKHFIYGTSFGGIVALTSFSNPEDLDLVILDGVPSSLDQFNILTYRDYAPINHLPSNCENFYIITSEKDSVIPAKVSKKLVERILLKGGETFEFQDRGHPFQQEDGDQKKERVLKIKKLVERML